MQTWTCAVCGHQCCDAQEMVTHWEQTHRAEFEKVRILIPTVPLDITRGQIALRHPDWNMSICPDLLSPLRRVSLSSN